MARSKTNISAPGLSKLIRGFQDRDAYIDSVVGQEINLNETRIFVQGGPYLHQDTDTMTEEESARFERENKKLFDWMRHFRSNIANRTQS